MFAIARMAPEEMWRTRMGLDELRNKMNTRVTGELAGCCTVNVLLTSHRSA
jgi:hypothetical protein